MPRMSLAPSKRPQDTSEACRPPNSLVRVLFTSFIFPIHGTLRKCLCQFQLGVFQRPLTLILLQKYRDTNGRRIVIQIGGVYTTFCQKRGILLQKYRDRNGRCIPILFRSIRVRARFYSSDSSKLQAIFRHLLKLWWPAVGIFQGPDGYPSDEVQEVPAKPSGIAQVFGAMHSPGRFQATCKHFSVDASFGAIRGQHLACHACDLVTGKYGCTEVRVYPAECGEQLGTDPSKIGSSKSLVLKSFSEEGTLWDSSLPVSLTLWDTPALFTSPLPLPQVTRGKFWAFHAHSGPASGIFCNRYGCLW